MCHATKPSAASNTISMRPNLYLKFCVCSYFLLVLFLAFSKYLQFRSVFMDLVCCVNLFIFIMYVHMCSSATHVLARLDV